MVSLEIVALVLTGTGLMASIIYYANILQNANKTQQLQLDTRQAQLFMQVYQEFSSPDFLARYFDVRNTQYSNYEDYVNQYGDLQEKDVNRYARWISVGTWFEGLGTLLKFELIDPIMVYEMMGIVVLSYWETRGTIIKEVQKNQPRYGIYIEYLKDEMLRLRKIRDPELAT